MTSLSHLLQNRLGDPFLVNSPNLIPKTRDGYPSPKRRRSSTDHDSSFFHEPCTALGDFISFNFNETVIGVIECRSG